MGPLTDDFPTPFYETLHDLTRRAQRAGLISADIVAEDLPRIIAMLHSVLATMDPASDGWRRYVTFILNAMSTAEPSKVPSKPDRLHAAARYLAQVRKPDQPSPGLGRVDALVSVMLPSEVIPLLVRERGAMFGWVADFEPVDAETMRPWPGPAVEECLTSRSAGPSIVAGRPPVEFRELRRRGIT